MLTMPAQRHCQQVPDELVYDNARVSVEMMIGGHVRPLKAVPASIQNIEVDAVVDQEERSHVDHCKAVSGHGAAMAHGGP